ncbi:MAG TPA: hypothetical protein VKH37_12755 [Ferruginibacter sp.]|nr:hypothetical protein [Ferruginibacter sp.]
MLKSRSAHLLLLIFLISCDSVSTLYKSPEVNHAHYKIKVANLTHCGCNEIYVKHYKDGRKDFIIFYGDWLPSKLLLQKGMKEKGISKYLYVTKDSTKSVRFDAVDKEIFAKIDSFISAGYYKKLHHPRYWGYSRDTTVISNKQ